jgi:hypothetical protein
MYTIIKSEDNTKVYQVDIPTASCIYCWKKGVLTIALKRLSESKDDVVTRLKNLGFSTEFREIQRTTLRAKHWGADDATPDLALIREYIPASRDTLSKSVLTALGIAEAQGGPIVVDASLFSDGDEQFVLNPVEEGPNLPPNSPSEKGSSSNA